MACASDVSLVGVLTGALDLTERAEVRLVGCLPTSLSSFPHSCWLSIRGGLLGVQLLLVSLALQMSLVRLHTHTHKHTYTNTHRAKRCQLHFTSTNHGAGTANLAHFTEVHCLVVGVILLPSKLGCSSSSCSSRLLDNIVSNHLLLGTSVATSVAE